MTIYLILDLKKQLSDEEGATKEPGSDGKKKKHRRGRTKGMVGGAG